MEGVVSGFAQKVLLAYDNAITDLNLQPWANSAILVVLLAVFLVLISLFIWKFYENLSKRDFITLNLAKYNLSSHSGARKFFAFILYLLEYIVIMPVLILVWFGALSIILLFIAQEQSVETTLLITASLVAAIRFLAYFKTEVAEDVAKLMPYITLATFLLSPKAFTLEKIILPIAQIPALFNNILHFLLAILIVEIALRFIYSTYKLYESSRD